MRTELFEAAIVLPVRIVEDVVDRPRPDAAHFARGIVAGSLLIDQTHARGGVDPRPSPPPTSSRLDESDMRMS